MPNDLIEITSLERFNELVPEGAPVPGNKVLLLVLGDAAIHTELKEVALRKSEYMRWTMWARNPSQLYRRLESMPIRQNEVINRPPWPPDIIGISISPAGVICRALRSTNGNAVNLAFQLAETNV